VNLSLSQKEETRLAQTDRVDHEAYEAYLMGNHFKGSGILEEDLMKAIGFYQLAIEKDPDFARAYAGLASGYVTLSVRFRPPIEVMPLALEAVHKALELDETYGEAYAILGTIRNGWLWDWTGAEAAHRKALEMKPNSTSVRRDYSQFLVGMLRFEEAVANQQRAVELSPLSRSAHITLGWVYWATGQYEKGAAYLSEHIDRYPDEIWGRLILSWTYSLMGRTSDGVIVAEEARDLHPAPFDDPFLVMSLVSAYGYASENEEAHAALRRLLELRRKEYIPSSYLAFAYSAINDWEGAIEWYRKTCEERHLHAILLRTYAEWKPSIGADPRIQALIQSMNFPED
jgi:tetratricopeptide (TPR) repeat protein